MRLLDAAHREWLTGRGFDPDAIVPMCVEMINSIVAGHTEVTTALHICRGNNRSMYVASGGYASLASRIFPERLCFRLVHFSPSQIGPNICRK